jgi:4a-hydroxytetrahydrobiopterin dehydratase
MRRRRRARAELAVTSPPIEPEVDHEACLATARIVAGPELDPRLAAMPGWSLQDCKLHRRLHFDGFAAAFAFVTGIGLLAERRNHHPSLCDDKRDVDVDLAVRIERLAERWS